MGSVIEMFEFVVNAKIYGMKEVAYKVGEFQNQMFEVGVEGIENISRWLKKSARIRARHGATKELVKSIDYSKPKFSMGVGGDRAEITLSAGGPKAPYAKFQEEGYAPHKVGPDWIGEWLSYRGLWSRFPKGFVKVNVRGKGYNPYIRPALEAVAPYVSEIAQGIPMKAARRAGLGGGR